MHIRPLSFGLTLSMVVIVCGISFAGGQRSGNFSSLVEQGFDISPVPKAKLNFAPEDYARVGFGSYLVNAIGDCSGCHSFPEFLPQGGPGTNPAAGSPFAGTPSDQSATGQLVANINSAHYLAGGQCFGPFMARNLTPEPNGMPEGLTEAEFIKVMRTGDDIHCMNEPNDPICGLGPDTATLQVMPWPTYHSMTDADLKAIYAYLTAIPPATACNTVANGCPGFSGDAKGDPVNYAYTNTPDCPNPAPPQ